MSRFVPAGSAPEDEPPPAPEDDAWAAARREVRSHGALRKDTSSQEPEKSLYDTLQANKAAKQAEFEESIRLKNQFRTLDEDEANFLDSVLESERAKETAVKRDTAEQLETYRRQQEAAHKTDLNTQTKTSSTDTDSWVTRKRRRKELDNSISKARKTSVANGPEAGTTSPITRPEQKQEPETLGNLAGKSDPGALSPNIEPPQTSALGLDAYSSDEE